MSRKSASLTNSEVKVYQEFCRANRIALDGADGEKNGALFAEIIGIKMDSDFTQDTLETAFEQLQGRLKLVSATYKAADDLARQLSPDEQQIYRVWSKNQKLLVGLDGSPEGYMNVKSLLEWQRGNPVTAHNLDLALGNIINNPRPGQRIHFHAQPQQQDRSVVQGKVNHAFNYKEESKKATSVQQMEFVNGRRNHAYTPPEEAQKKVAVQAPDAWKEICQLHLKEWVTPGQRDKLQAEYDAGIATGKSWREIGTALGQIVKGSERGR
jgi:hypothetical protein